LQNPINPYRHLANQARALLRTESEMSPELRETFSWMIRADFCDTHATVVKGGANTMIVMLGPDGERKPSFPREAIEQLDRLGRQEFPIYAIKRHDSGKKLFYFDLSRALAVKPRTKDTLWGLSDVGRRQTHEAMLNSVNVLKWIRK
jgi:hypothetical protein